MPENVAHQFPLGSQTHWSSLTFHLSSPQKQFVVTFDPPKPTADFLQLFVFS